MREPKPFWREQTQSYYAKIGGKFVPLGTDKAKAKVKCRELVADYRRLRDGETVDGATVCQILDAFYQAGVRGIGMKKLAPSTCDRRKGVLKSFGLWIGPTLPAIRLKNHHIANWLAEQTWTDKNTPTMIVKQAFAWAKRLGHLSANPVEEMPVEPKNIRQEFIPVEDWAKLLDAAKDFRDFLAFMLLTGCRVQEIRILEKRFLQSDCFVLPREKSKGRKRNRVIELPAEALEIVNRLCEKHPEGYLFRNRQGRQWTRNAIRCRFRRFKTIMGMPGLTATTLRHSFCQQRLVMGQDSNTVAKLMGHVDTRMVETRYGHIEQNRQFMKTAINLVPSLDSLRTVPNQLV